MRRTWVANIVSVVSVVVASGGCLTTRPSLEPPVQKLESRTEVVEAKTDLVTSQGDFVEKGSKGILFSGFFADGQRVDELTLYHLAGDEPRRDEIVEYRTQYNTAVMAGWGGSALGAGLVAAGGVMLAVLGSNDPEAFFVSQQGQIAFGLMSGGGLVLAAAPIAAVYMFMPKRSLHAVGDTDGVSEELVFPLGDATEAITSFERRDAASERGGVTPATDATSGG